MDYVCLNPRVLNTPEKMHEHLWRELNFSNAYGMNLDALYDELTSRFLDTSILCLQFEQDGQIVYPHVVPFYRVIRDAARVNPHLRVDKETLPAF